MNEYEQLQERVKELEAHLSEAWEECDRLKALGNKLYGELMQWAPTIRDRRTAHVMRDWENEIFHNRQQEDAER